MGFKVVLILVLSVFLTVECRRLTKDNVPRGKEVVQSIPESERPIFIAYALGHGFMDQYGVDSAESFPFPTLLRIPKKLEEKFEALEKPRNFTSNLYQFVKSTYGLGSPSMFALIIRRRVCFPSGKCINLENIGELCCPF